MGRITRRPLRLSDCCGAFLLREKSYHTSREALTSACFCFWNSWYAEAAGLISLIAPSAATKASRIGLPVASYDTCLGLGVVIDERRGRGICGGIRAEMEMDLNGIEMEINLNDIMAADAMRTASRSRPH